MVILTRNQIKKRKEKLKMVGFVSFIFMVILVISGGTYYYKKKQTLLIEDEKSVELIAK